MDSKWLYGIDAAQVSVDGDWDRTRGPLGGKGANLGDMTRLGIPVPPGFTITTQACNAYDKLGGELPPGVGPSSVRNTIVSSVRAKLTGSTIGAPSTTRPIRPTGVDSAGVIAGPSWRVTPGEAVGSVTPQGRRSGGATNG